MPSHPASRFVAPRSIQAGSSLADLLDATAIGLIGDSFTVSMSGFDLTAFVADATSAVENLSLKSRAVAIAKVLRQALPADDHAALACLRRSWGPELTRTHDNGLGGLFYMPHSALLGEFGGSGDDVLFAAALDANFELTTRFTAEFSIRPFLHARLNQTLQRLGERIDDPNPHIRRLISEGTRPRLPWATHLQAVRADPTLTLPLLTALRDDPDRYVTRSVANHLGDLGKDHPDLLLETCRVWLDELTDLCGAAAKERRWLIRHALRHPAKKGIPSAVALRQQAA